MKKDGIHEDVRALKQRVKNVCVHAVSACMHRAKPYAVFFPLLFRGCRSVSCKKKHVRVLKTRCDVFAQHKARADKLTERGDMVATPTDNVRGCA